MSTSLHFTIFALLLMKSMSLAKTSSCDICKDLAENFKKGLEKTVKSNFGGGNTKWEEKSLGKWRTSETRLVEIVEHHLCENNEKKCHMMFENHEDAIEDWYFNKFKQESDADKLYDYLCVETIKVCCTLNTFGKDCQPCPSVDGAVCNNHGKCQGSGTRAGDGTCSCDAGYTGSNCEECKEGFYEKSNGKSNTCQACDISCEDTCTDEGPKGCDECNAGFVWDDAVGCKDVDECQPDTQVCSQQPNSYCLNTDGSYVCQACHYTCQTCSGGGSTECLLCKEGYELTTNDTPQLCADINECNAIENPCSNLANSVCVNNEGSFECRCPENQMLQENECINIPEQPEVQESAQNTPAKTNEEDSLKGKQKISKAETKTTKQSATKTSTESRQSEYTAGKRKYRMLDSLVLISATVLYLVLCLVFKAETYRTALVTLIYGTFVYNFSGQFL